MYTRCEQDVVAIFVLFLIRLGRCSSCESCTLGIVCISSNEEQQEVNAHTGNIYVFVHEKYLPVNTFTIFFNCPATRKLHLGAVADITARKPAAGKG